MEGKRDKDQTPIPPSGERDAPRPNEAPYWFRDENVRRAFYFPREGLEPYPERGRFFGVGPKGYRRSDERIREDVSDRLMSHPDVDASEIEVHVANGVVTLEGVIENRHQKRIAEFLAEDVLGVSDVENHVKVRHGFWAAVTGERATERELKRSHARDEASEAEDRVTRASVERSNSLGPPDQR
ncbi:MAG TPA: BON domain-containing protein [Gemmatimonadaceae bacterium]|jgi:BON domain|nr:BON domain-containing protein [Gemmatimonadaceae bacterium]